MDKNAKKTDKIDYKMGNKPAPSSADKVRALKLALARATEPSLQQVARTGVLPPQSAWQRVYEHLRRAKPPEWADSLATLADFSRALTALVTAGLLRRGEQSSTPSRSSASAAPATSKPATEKTELERRLDEADARAAAQQRRMRHWESKSRDDWAQLLIRAVESSGRQALVTALRSGTLDASEIRAIAGLLQRDPQWAPLCEDLTFFGRCISGMIQSSTYQRYVDQHAPRPAAPVASATPVASAAASPAGTSGKHDALMAYWRSVGESKWARDLINALKQLMDIPLAQKLAQKQLTVEQLAELRSFLKRYDRAWVEITAEPQFFVDRIYELLDSPPVAEYRRMLAEAPPGGQLAQQTAFQVDQLRAILRRAGPSASPHYQSKGVDNSVVWVNYAYELARASSRMRSLSYDEFKRLLWSWYSDGYIELYPARTQTDVIIDMDNAEASKINGIPYTIAK